MISIGNYSYDFSNIMYHLQKWSCPVQCIVLSKHTIRPKRHCGKGHHRDCKSSNVKTLSLPTAFPPTRIFCKLDHSHTTPIVPNEIKKSSSTVVPNSVPLHPGASRKTCEFVAITFRIWKWETIYSHGQYTFVYWN